MQPFAQQGVQLEFNFDTPLEKAIKHAFKIGFVRGTKQAVGPKHLQLAADNKTIEDELQIFLKQIGNQNV